jgi:hypothetical protein
VGQLIMLGWLFGLVALIFGLVLKFDPLAKRTPDAEDTVEVHR